MWFSRLSSIFVVVHGAGASLSQVSAKDALKQGTVSRTLASYQKYADELVNAYLSGQPDDKAARDAIIVIYKFFDDLHDAHIEQHKLDLLVGPNCLTEMQQCSDHYLGTDVLNQLNNLSADEEHWRDLHKECRDAQATGCSSSHDGNGWAVPHNEQNQCDAYDNYRKHTWAAKLPDCAKKATASYALGSPQIMSNELTQQSALHTMESCLENMHLWLDQGYEMAKPPAHTLFPGRPGLYPRYKQCSRGEKCCEDAAYCDPYDSVPEAPGFCDVRQAKFEAAHCLYESMRDSKCVDFQTCRTDEDKRCKDACDTVELHVAGRKADNETMERIKCLFTVVLNETAINKTAELASCKEADYSDMRAFWDIDGCPPGGDNPVVPGDSHCREAEEFTCLGNFMEREYWGTWSHNIIADCQHCAAQLSKLGFSFPR